MGSHQLGDNIMGGYNGGNVKIPMAGQDMYMQREPSWNMLKNQKDNSPSDYIGEDPAFLN